MVAQRFFLIREKIMNFEQSISILKKTFSFSINFSNFARFAFLLIKAIHYVLIFFLHAVILFRNTHKVHFFLM